MEGFRTVVGRIYHDNSEKATAAKKQFLAYKNRRGLVLGERHL